MWLKKHITFFSLTAFLVVAGYYFLDTRVALFVAGMHSWSTGVLSGEIPDFLLLYVLAVTVFSWTASVHLTRRGIIDHRARFFQLIAITTPLAYVAKSFLKFVFGRIETRFWLTHPAFPGFHWFGGSDNFNGFPSGHAAVFAVLAFALWRTWPRSRAFVAAFFTLLALSLVATNYHFASDVVAGLYVGYLVDYSVDAALARRDKLVKSFFTAKDAEGAEKNIKL